MSNIDILTIIGFGVVGVIMWQLWRILGSRTGFQKTPKPPKKAGDVLLEKEMGVVQTIHQDRNEKPPLNREKVLLEIDNVSEKNPLLREGLRAIYEKDPYFSPEKFQKEAQSAYEIILEGFIRGDKEALQSLLSKSLYQDFEKEIQLKEKEQQKTVFSFIGITDFMYKSAIISDTVVKITVQFISQLVYANYDKDGNLVSGKPNSISYNKDLWRFERDFSISDPTWLLVDTCDENHKT